MVLPVVGYALTGLAFLGAAWSLALVVLDRRLDDPLFWLLAALEAGLLAQLIGGSVALAVSERVGIDGVTFVGYQITAAAALPVAVAWAASERTRWGVGVLLVACLTVAAMVQRMLQVWQG